MRFLYILLCFIFGSEAPTSSFYEIKNLKTFLTPTYTVSFNMDNLDNDIIKVDITYKYEDGAEYEITTDIETINDGYHIEQEHDFIFAGQDIKIIQKFYIEVISLDNIEIKVFAYNEGLQLKEIKKEIITIIDKDESNDYIYSDDLKDYNEVLRTIYMIGDYVENALLLNEKSNVSIYTLANNLYPFAIIIFVIFMVVIPALSSATQFQSNWSKAAQQFMLMLIIFGFGSILPIVDIFWYFAKMLLYMASSLFDSITSDIKTEIDNSITDSHNKSLITFAYATIVHNDLDFFTFFAALNLILQVFFASIIAVFSIYLLPLAFILSCIPYYDNLIPKIFEKILKIFIFIFVHTIIYAILILLINEANVIGADVKYIPSSPFAFDESTLYALKEEIEDIFYKLGGLLKTVLVVFNPIIMIFALISWLDLTDLIDSTYAIYITLYKIIIFLSKCLTYVLFLISNLIIQNIVPIVFVSIYLTQLNTMIQNITGYSTNTNIIGKIGDNAKSAASSVASFVISQQNNPQDAKKIQEAYAKDQAKK